MPTDLIGRADISVVIPAFNAERVIERALQSVVKQTLLPREVLVVDDGSAPASAFRLDQILAAFKSRETLEIRFIRFASNRGAASARNAGWSESCGKYVAFLDSDDSWHPSKLEIQVGYLNANPEVMLCGHAHEVRSQDEPWEDFNEMLIAPNPVTASMLLVRNRFITPSAMLRRDIPQRFEEGQRHMEDHLLWSRIAMSGAKIDYLPIVLARIHKRGVGEGGLSNQLIAMQVADIKNYWKLREEGYLGGVMAFVYSSFSLVKFGRRIALLILWRFRRLFGASR